MKSLKKHHYIKRIQNVSQLLNPAVQSTPLRWKQSWTLVVRLGLQAFELGKRRLHGRRRLHGCRTAAVLATLVTTSTAIGV